MGGGEVLDLTMEAKDVIGLVGLALTAAIFLHQQRRANRVARQETYVRLELASNDVFRFEAGNARVVELSFKTPSKLTAEEERIATSYYTQILNLFELATTLRANGTLPVEVYNSWLAWKYELAESRWMQREWPELSNHYTRNFCQLMSLALESVKKKETFLEFSARARARWDKA